LALTGVINDRYSIERELGRGGMATVYLARDLRQGNRVALKVLTSDFASMVSGERFSREIRITAGLQHPHILPVFDSGSVNGLPYYVMPFVDGPTLSEKIKKEGPLPIDEALEIATEVADALQHAHAQGIVHRDIKPSNILLAHGHAVVADFGVARAVETFTEQDLTRTGIAVGTAAYMSPEQAAGEAVDGRSDIYSLGCVLYEMLAGRPPYAAENPRALMAKHWMDAVPSLRTARPAVRASVDELVRKAMAKRPMNRFATAGELEDAIKSVSTEERLAAIGYTPSDDQPSFAPGSFSRLTPHDSSAPSAHAVPSTNGTGPVSGENVRAPSGRRGYIVGALAAVAIIAVAASAWYILRPREPGLDRNRVIVYPLVVPDDFKGSRNVGEDIGTMIGTALDGIGALRWVDGWPLLAPAVRQDIRNLSGAEARTIARSRRAAWYLGGRIVSRGDSSEVFVELNDVAGDSTVARGRATGLTSDAWRTGLRAVNSILPMLIPPGTSTEGWLAEWTDRDPAASASFLLAESAFRRVHLSEALDRYRDALKSDSTFGLAAIRGAQAAAWNHRSEEAQSLIDVAIRQPLSPRYMHFARGYEAYLEGAADSAAKELHRAIELDPGNSAAWMQLGEVYTHLLPVAGTPDSLARIAFDEAHRIDPAARNLLLHSIEIRLREGDSKSAAPLVTEFLAGDPDTVLAEQVKMMYDCVKRGTGSVEWTDEAKKHPLSVLALSNTLKGGGSQIPCVMRGYDAVMRSDTSRAAAGRKWSATLGLGSVYVLQNRPAAAVALMDSSIASGAGGGSFYLAAGVVYPELLARAREIAARDEKNFGPNYAGAPTPVRLWQLGVLEALYGRRTVAEAVERSLRDRAARDSLKSDLRLAESLKAFNALSRGDTALALKTFQDLVAAPVPGGEIVWDIAAPRGLERLTLARLLAARGDYRKAIDIANVFDASWPSIYLLYVPASLQLRADAARALQDNALATRFRSRLASVRGEQAVAGK
jgi:serine/threonine protein kinase/tetratricopeptide (TPR) repeat protein